MSFQPDPKALADLMQHMGLYSAKRHLRNDWLHDQVAEAQYSLSYVDVRGEEDKPDYERSEKYHLKRALSLLAEALEEMIKP